MWDNTGIPMFKPSDPELQRLTYSSYYAGNVFKGAIGIQLCGWITTEELYTGGMSDSEYFLKCDIIKKQQDYVPIYDINNQSTSWTIILDKGYRGANVLAWDSGKQMIVQPCFARSDRRFTSAESLVSAAVAHDRSGNERAVKYIKHCGFLDKGLRGHENEIDMADVWLAWGFQLNFIYKSVL
jgi:DDE superfamily endonuclease